MQPPTRTIGIDFETFYIDKEYSIKNMGQRGYVRDPRFDPYLVSVCDGKESWAGHPRDFNFEALRGARLLSHNRAFDELVYHVGIERNLWPSIPYAEWHCTANLTTYLCMRRDILRASEFLLGETVDKSYRTDADGKNEAALKAAGAWDKVCLAGRVDATRCFQFWAKFGHLWPQMERDISDLTIRQCRRGSQIDVEKLNKFLVVAQTMLIQAGHDLPWIATGSVPNSTKALAEKCREVGIPCAPVKSRDGEDAYDAWAATYGPKHSWVKAFTDYRVINKFIGTLEKVKERLDAEGTFSYELLYFGAHTGRWSGSGGFNMQNMRRDPLFCDQDGRLITDLDMLREIDSCASKENPVPSFVAHALDIRALFIARPGKKLIISDLSQIEPRALAWIVGDKVMLGGLASGQSPYEAHARATMNWAEGELKKGNKELYALAKARVLGLGYGCGWRKFITVAQVMAGLDITKDDPEFVPAVNDDGQPVFQRAEDGTLSPIMVSGYGSVSKKTVQDYRESNPLICSNDDDRPGIWRKLDNAFRASEGGDFAITLPSGRQLRYPSVRRERKMVQDPDNPGKLKARTQMTALAFDQKRNAVVRQPFYGGVLTENLIQAFARDVFCHHLLLLDRTPGIDVLFSVHDEAVCEVDPAITAKDVEHIMSQCPEWCAGLPLAAEAQEVDCYKK